MLRISEKHGECNREHRRKDLRRGRKQTTCRYRGCAGTEIFCDEHKGQPVYNQETHLTRKDKNRRKKISFKNVEL